MTDSEKIPFAKLIGELNIAFGREPNKEQMKVYFKHLQTFTLFQVSMAIMEIIEKDERFPVLSRVRSLAATKKKHKPEPYQDVPQIEEVVLPNDLPRTKEDFFKAMDELVKKVSI
ncbi:MAG: hypothetical protein PF440_06605 [Thiomicrorhabdus sp.]|jgi:hypothetical protein|nr:hypothetical protein [Thiomicrorhabdus sp.]